MSDDEHSDRYLPDFHVDVPEKIIAEGALANMEQNRGRVYSIGDRFYISPIVSQHLETIWGEEGKDLVPGTSIVLQGSVNALDQTASPPATFIFPDGKMVAGEISFQILQLLPPDRRYGSPLDLGSKERAKAISNAFKRDRPSVLRATDNTANGIPSFLRREILRVMAQVSED